MSAAHLALHMYPPALTTISRALHTDTASIELTFSTFLMGFHAGQLIWGPISDRYGRKLPIAIGMILSCSSYVIHGEANIQNVRRR